MADSYGHQPASPEISPHSDNEGGHYGSHDASVREQDRFLPIANVSRIMKKALPSNAKISKDAKETVQECVSEFISFITGVCCDCGFLFDRILTGCTWRIHVPWCDVICLVISWIRSRSSWRSNEDWLDSCESRFDHVYWPFIMMYWKCLNSSWHVEWKSWKQSVLVMNRSTGIFFLEWVCVSNFRSGFASVTKYTTWTKISRV